ncbi:MAG: hypothetical protein ACK5MW_04930 [Enterococcus sp.]
MTIEENVKKEFEYRFWQIGKLVDYYDDKFLTAKELEKKIEQLWSDWERWSEVLVSVVIRSGGDCEDVKQYSEGLLALFLQDAQDTLEQYIDYEWRADK